MKLLDAINHAVQIKLCISNIKYYSLMPPLFYDRIAIDTVTLIIIILSLLHSDMNYIEVDGMNLNTVL